MGWWRVRTDGGWCIARWCGISRTGAALFGGFLLLSAHHVVVLIPPGRQLGIVIQLKKKITFSFITPSRYRSLII